MSTLRITNIEAKADPSSPTVDEKIKLTNSNGDILVHIDGKTSGITTIGINTTAGNIKFDQNSNVVVTGIITATKFVGTIEPTSLEIGSNIKLGNAGVITATSYVGDGSALTGIDATQIQTGNTSVQTVDTGSNGHVKINTEGTEKARITSDGNIGVKVTNPDLTLHVNGVNALPSTSGSTPAGHLTLRAKAQSSSHGMFMGVSNASPWSSWIQAQDANNNATNYPLLLNPNGGNVGINETSPSHVLDVKSQADGTYFINGQNHNGNNIFQVYESSDGDGNHGMLYLNNGSGTTLTKISTNGSSYFNGGNVGIKETSPACSLHVDSGTDNLVARFESSDAGAKIELKDNNATSSIEQNSNEFIFNSDSGAADGSSRMSFKIDNSEAMRIDSSGRLLLGTTVDGYSSADNFTIADTGNCGLTIRSGTSSLGTIAFSDATSGTGEYSGFIQYNQSNRHLIFGTESDEHVRIDNNGHLEVDYDSSNNARVQFGFATGVWITGNSSDGHQRFYTNSAERIRSGYNGQGTEFSNQNSVRPGADNSIDLGSGSYRYDDVYATNGTIQTSDSRLKQEVVTSVLGIDFIKALRPVSYKWIEGKKVPIVDGTDENGDNIYRSDADGNWVYNSRAGARRHWGFIAQEVKQAVDDAGVDFAGWSLADKDDSNSTQSLRYEEFIAPLTKALQEAIAKIETLEARIAALEG